MHDQMREEGVSETGGDTDIETARIPFLAVLPDMSLHVAVLEQDVHTATAPLVPRQLPTVGETEPISDPMPAASEARSTRFVPPADPGSSSSRTLSAELQAASTSVPMPQHSTQQTHSVSGRLRQFGLMALPSLRRAELADIPDSLVWSIAIVDPARAALPPLSNSSSMSGRIGWLPGSSRSIRRHGSSASHALSRRGSLRRGTSLRSDAGDTAGFSASIPMHARASTGGAPLPPTPFRGASPPLPGGHSSAPLRGGSPALRPVAPAAGASGGWVELDPAAPATDAAGGPPRVGSPLAKPAKAASRSRSLRGALSFRSTGADGYVRLADVSEAAPPEEA